MVFEWLKQRRAKQRRLAHELGGAEAQFSLSYPSRTLIHAMTSVFHDAGDFVVVQICYDWGGKPPQRSWWLVASDGSCRELSVEDAHQIRPVPVWR